MYCIVEVTNGWEEISQEGRPGHVALVLMERAGCSPHPHYLLGENHPAPLLAPVSFVHLCTNCFSLPRAQFCPPRVWCFGLNGNVCVLFALKY